ncbi:MAG TPA: DNA cytosine methyltransferase [Verrucomicrobiae bacterium]|nr:DNA cytosine methyltransferase [Verrucomicrobiae bacterium]
MTGKSKSGKTALPRVPKIPVHARNLKKDNEARQQRAAKELHEDAPEYHANVCSVRPVAETNRAAGSTLQPAAETKPRFVDLFCGIGGFRLAFERAGGRCVFSSDWNEKARETYKANFGEQPHGDIHTVAVADIPEHETCAPVFPVSSSALRVP